MKAKFQIYTTTCRRCGKAISTGNRSLHGADAAKAKYDRVCAACTTPDEEYEMAREIGRAIVRQAA